jgi:hypothetical protein
MLEKKIFEHISFCFFLFTSNCRNDLTKLISSLVNKSVSVGLVVEDVEPES